MGVSSGDFPPNGHRASPCQAQDRWGSSGDTKICKQTKINFLKKIILWKRDIYIYSMMSFLLFLLPVLGQTLSNTIILDSESESESDAFVLERVKRGFYT